MIRLFFIIQSDVNTLRTCLADRKVLKHLHTFCYDKKSIMFIILINWEVDIMSNNFYKKDDLIFEQSFKYLK